MSWDQKKPWTAPARTLVLYRTEDRWRYAIYNEAGILDGYLPGLSPCVALEVAQATLLADVERHTGLDYEAKWAQDKPDWWSAELHPRDSAGTR